jgi:hypothetical protein
MSQGLPFEEDDSFDTERGLIAGVVGMAPLLITYEVLQRSGASARCSSELYATAILQPLGDWEGPARAGLVLSLLLFSAFTCLREGAPLVPLIGRQVLRGALYSFLLGPSLMLMMALLGHTVTSEASQLAPSGSEVLLAVSGAAWEELVFRVGLYGLLFLGARRFALFSGVTERWAPFFGEAVGLVGSSVLFAAAHLELFSGMFGRGGEEFSAAAFTFRFGAGILLGLLFRWRGAGVSAWSHGLFNLCLAVGWTPAVLVG